MFNKIIKASDGTVLALTEDVTYIKKADNGCYILCPEPDASGISYAGTPYQLFDRDQMGDELETVMLEQTDIGSWIMESKSAIEDADEMNVDQAYRLTLLELNVSDTDDTEKSNGNGSVSHLQAHDRARQYRWSGGEDRYFLRRRQTDR